MKASDFMLGDWVLVNDVPLQVDALSDNSCGFCDSEGKIYWAQEGFDNLVPIPLTEEILARNGFDYAFYTVSETLDIRLMVAKINGDYIEIRLDKKTIGVWLDYDENGDGVYSDYLFPLPCYVHEFQHALRLCGIEKQIVVL